MNHLAVFSYHDGLEELLLRRYRSVPVSYHFRENPAIKDPIEAMGVPHTEVDIVLANGRSVGFDYRLADGDTIAVYPPLARGAAADALHLCPPLELPARFVLDVHLGKLARRLRLLGFDSCYRNDLIDDELVRIALGQERVLLSRDRGLLKRRSLRHGCLIRSGRIDEQVRQVLDRYRLTEEVRPWQRCMICNGLVEAVAKDTVMGRLEEKTRRYYDSFHRCRGCGRLYWAGSHFDKIEAWLAAIMADGCSS